MQPLTKPSLFILFVSFCLFTATAMAQKLELSVNANSGLFNYTGSGAANPNPYYAPVTNYYNPVNAYSTKLTFSYGANLQGQYVFKSGFITGLQAGYDLLRSKANLGGNYPTYYLDAGFYPINAFNAVQKGTASTTDQFINLSPYFGYRIVKDKKVNVDLTAGADLAFGIKSKQTITATAPSPYHASGSNTNPPTDYRLKAGVVIHVKKMDFNFSYAHGLTNYIKYDSDPLKAYSQLIRFGVGYQIL